MIKCKDGSKAFNRGRLNDNYCDCVDGTDEPGIVVFQFFRIDFAFNGSFSIGSLMLGIFVFIW